MMFFIVYNFILTNLQKILTTRIKRCCLNKLIKLYPGTRIGKKALFLLAVSFQKTFEWDSAIKYFTQYIIKYSTPESPSLKAYARLIESYWSTDASNLFSLDEIEKVANIVTCTSDYETQLRLASRFNEKGLHELSLSTFTIGLCTAKKFMARSSDKYLALKTLYNIGKYSYSLKEYGLLEKSSSSFLSIAEKITPSHKNKQNINLMKNQTSLWLAKAYQSREEYKSAKI